ncbi:hypothetical protein [Brevundimonas naejangsanensis]
MITSDPWSLAAERGDNSAGISRERLGAEACAYVSPRVACKAMFPVEFLCLIPSLYPFRRLPCRLREKGDGRPCPSSFTQPVCGRFFEHPDDFHAALDLQIRRHGENSHRLHRAIVAAGGLTDRTTLAAWRRGLKVPQTPASLKVLDIIEHRYRLETGYLRSRLQRRRALRGLVPPETPYSESRRLAWHLPDDFDERSAREQEEILDWVRSTILSGGTAYHRYHSTVSKHRFALRFDDSGPEDLAAPAHLREEMDALLRFKSATLTDIGYQRSGVWGRKRRRNARSIWRFCSGPWPPCLMMRSAALAWPGRT